MRSCLSLFSANRLPRYQHGPWLLILLAISYLAASSACLGATPGLMVFHSINLTGSGAIFDSYDSSDPTKSSNGLYNSTIYAGDHCDIATDGTSTDGSSVSIGSAHIYGIVHIAGCPVSVTSSGGVGTHAWLATNSGFEPGFVLSDANFLFPSISLPPGNFPPPTGGYAVTTNYSSTNIVTTTYFPDPFPPGGVQTNVVSVTTTNLPNPIPDGLVTNITSWVTSALPPTPVPAGTTTNILTTPTTTTNYPDPGTYVGSVTTNYNGHGGLIKNYSYNLITGYTYTYPLYSYTYSYFTYTYYPALTNPTYTTNYYSAILLPGSASRTNTLGSGLVLVRASSPPTNATLILTGGLIGNENFVLEPGAHLVLYCDSPVTLYANQITNPNGNASSFTIYGTPNATSVTLRGNGTFTGLIVTPSANVSVPKSGNNQVDYCGALVANSFTDPGNFAFHFDEALSTSPIAPNQIISQPKDQEVVAGQNATFNVSMSPGLYAYQWYFGANLGFDYPTFSWGPIPGATNSTLALTNVDQTDIFGSISPMVLYGGQWQGAYYVTISNSSSVLTSSVAFLTVHFPPSIAVQPFSQSATPGSDISFSMTRWYISDRPWSFQWRLNGSVIPSATNSTLSISNVNSNNVGNYDVIFSNPYGSVTSQTATASLTIAPDFLWARGASNCALAGISYSSGSSVQAVATTTSGQLVVAGTFAGPGIALDPAVVLTNDSTYPDYFYTRMNFLCQYDASGYPLWGVTLGTITGNNSSIRVGLDGSNNIFVAGNFSRSLQFDANALVTTNTDMFVGKWGPGSWARQIKAGDPAIIMTGGFGFAVDPAGNVFIASRDAGTADFGSIVLTNSSAFLAKYDNAGNLLWATEALPAYAIALGTNGSIYLVSQVSIPYQGRQGVLAKYDNNANLVWSRVFPLGLAIVTDAYENLYVTGSGAGTFDGFTITNAGGGPDFFVAKCDSTGHILWLKQAGSIKQQAGTGICVDRFGDVFVSSLGLNKLPDPSLSFDSITITNVMGFVAEFDYQGRALCAFTANTNAAFQAVAGSSPDAIYASGAFYNSPKFGNCTLTNNNLYPYADGEALLTKLAGISPGPTAARLMPHLSAGSQFQFDLFGTPTFPYVIESSTNLTDWLPITTNTSPSTFTDPNSSNHPFNYYRAVYRP